MQSEIGGLLSRKSGRSNDMLVLEHSDLDPPRPVLNPRMDVTFFILFRARSSLSSLGPGFDEREHPFVSSAAPVTRIMIPLRSGMEIVLLSSHMRRR